MSVCGKTLVALCAAVAAMLFAGTADSATTLSPRACSRTLPCPLYGVTVDDPSHLSALVASEKALPRRPTTRLVLDVGSSVSDYSGAVHALHRTSYLMGELLDSSEEKQVSPTAEHARVGAYLRAYGGLIDIWEVGNEVNGNWTGPYQTVSKKLIDAYDEVRARGGRTALTLFANDLAPNHCGDGPAELTPAQFSRDYIPASVRNGLTYVFVSYYEQNCGGVRPSAAIWTTYFRALHALYAHAALGFGEVGLIHPANASTLAYAQGVMRHYYSLRVDLPYFAGGDFWWNYAEDADTTAAPLWQTLNSQLRRLPRSRAR